MPVHKPAGVRGVRTIHGKKAVKGIGADGMLRLLCGGRLTRGKRRGWGYLLRAPSGGGFRGGRNEKGLEYCNESGEEV